MASLPSPSWLSAASGCDRARPGGCDAWLFASPRDLGGDTLQRLRAAVKAQERSGAPSSRIVADTLHLASRDFESWYLPALDLRHGSRLLERSRNQLSDQKSHADPDRTNDHAAHRSLPPGRGYSRDGAGTVIHACRAGAKNLRSLTVIRASDFGVVTLSWAAITHHCRCELPVKFHVAISAHAAGNTASHMRQRLSGRLPRRQIQSAGSCDRLGSFDAAALLAAHPPLPSGR